MIEFEKSHHHRPQGGRQGLGDAPGDLQRRFEEQLQSPSPQGQEVAAETPQWSSPFDLLANRAPSASAAASVSVSVSVSASVSVSLPTDEECTESLMQSLKSVVGQMMIGSNNDGARLLRIEIDPSVLPGVSVTVGREAGAWVAEFECTHEESFLRLARPAQPMSHKMAEMLGQDAIWRVLARGLPSPGEWQQILQGHLERPGVEARAAAPI